MTTNSGINRIRVKASGEYDVIIGNGLLSKVGEYVKEVIKPCKVMVVTDDNVNGLYTDTVSRSLLNAGYQVYITVFKNGESSKNINVYADILNRLAQSEFTRTDLVVALGGGVVGDMAGFAAATFLRGIKYVQVPTTLLADVDSSVGGKTAIDLESGKNLVGAFCQPSAVICDTSALKTLPESVFLDGLGEIVKYAILDPKIYELVKKGDYDIETLIALSVDYKRRIVEEDEFEGGKRKLLNLGHTIAHAIERLSEYKITHGHAVAIGVGVILDLSLKQGYINEQTHLDLKGVVSKLVGECPCPFKLEDIARACGTDKKRAGDDITLVTVYGVGDCRFTKVKVGELTEFLL